MHDKLVPPSRAWNWLKLGIQQFAREPGPWLAMATVYLVLAILLSQIPFVGWLILVLFTPLAMLGALSSAQAERPPTEAVPRPWSARIRELFRHATRQLLRGFSEEEKLLPIMVISTLLLGGVVVVNLLAQLLKVGGASLPAMLAGSVGPTVWITALIGLVVVVTLEALLLMAFLYTVPLILFRREHPLPSIEQSFNMTRRNLGAFAIYASVFALIGQAMRVLFLFFLFPYDYLIFLAVGLVALPVFITSLHAGYQDLFSPGG